MVMSWAIAFTATLAIEAPIYLWLLRERGWRFGVTMTLLGNLLTHPIACWLVSGAEPAWGRFVAAELFAWLSEALLLVVLGRAFQKRIDWSQSVWIALAANATSAGIGLLIAGL
jgi:hypothetical protein